MSDMKLAWTYLRSRPLVTLLTILSLSLGLALAIIVLVLARQSEDMLSSETANWDIVVGSKGSPLQLVLNSLYYLDAPTGNVDISVWEALQKDLSISKVIPLSMGDNFMGAPIVGTTGDFFADRAARSDHPLLRHGKLFERPFELVAGAEVARQNHLQLGQKLVSAHGWAKSNDLHPQFPYTVVGILSPSGTSMDRVLYSDYHSTWLVHAHPDADEPAVPGHDPTHEVTVLLVRLHHSGARFRMVQQINLHHNAMAVIPVEEIDRLASSLISPLQTMLLGVAYLVVLVSGLSILLSLYLTIHQRRRDMAVLRLLGATSGDVFRLVSGEALALAGFGIVAGWVLGHGLLAAASPLLFERTGLWIRPWAWTPTEPAIAVSVWALGGLAGLLPAIIAYRLPVADTLYNA